MALVPVQAFFHVMRIEVRQTCRKTDGNIENLECLPWPSKHPKKTHEPVKLQKNYFKSALVNNKMAEHELNQAKSQKKQSNKRKQKKKTMTVIEHFQQKQNHAKNADLLQAFQVWVRCAKKYCAGHQKQREMSFKIHCFRCLAQCFGYIRWKHIET